MERVYIAIDLKSFYASVECVERGLDPMTTHLVVADWSRTEKTICLAVSPSLKAYGLPGRARLFEVVQKVEEINALRRAKAPGRTFTGASADEPELRARPDLALGYVTAPPQMAHYMDVSTKIYQIYLRHIAPEDIHVYSIDEVFIDATGYLAASGLNARELAMKLILEVLNETGITATAGIGTNLYLCKVAMDIGAKHIQPDENGVRIAELDEMSYRRTLWAHRPLTDFWRVGRGYAKKLETHGLYTMGDIARCSIGKSTEFYNEELLYRLFGVNAQLLIDHSWGWESCTITCSNSLDEYIIQDLLLQGACIDSFGVGERLITAKSEPVFGGVYKLVAVERESGEVVPKIKVSENVAKITIPHFKKFFRFYDRTNGKALADYLCLYDETPDDTQPLTIFHPENTWKRKTLTNFRAENMMVPVFRAGELVYDLPSLKDIRKRCAEQLETLWPEVLRFENPHGYYVDLSNRLWDIRHDLLVNAGHSQIPEKQ